jgi:M6 family metalloprotease-like protein
MRSCSIRRTSRTTLSAALLAVLWATPLAVLAAQSVPQADAFTTPAHTEWARRGQVLAEGNLAKLRALADGARLPGGGASRSVSADPGLTPLTGALTQVMLPVSFRDFVVPFPTPAIQARFYGAGSARDYSVSQYYSEVSLGRFTVKGTVLSTVRLTDTVMAYTGTSTGGAGIDMVRLERFVVEALNHADSTTDWTAFADPADPTHRVPAIVFLYAGRDGQCPGNTGTPSIRPHRYTLSQLTGAPFRTHSKMADGQYVLIDDYIIEGTTACDGGLAHVGTVTHETGHLLGLPDLYNVATQAGSPVGRWDLMGYGNRGADAAVTGHPSHLGAWSKGFLGWSNVTTANPAAGSSVAEAVRYTEGTNDAVLVPVQNSSEFLLAETRQWRLADAELPGQGVILWQIDPQVVSATLAANQVNADVARPGIAVIAADGQVSDLGDVGDIWPYPTTTRSFNQFSTPAFRSRQTGGGSGMALDNIRLQYQGVDLIGQFTVRADPAQGAAPTGILPATALSFATGRHVQVHFHLADSTRIAAGDSVVWSTDAASVARLARLGLQLNPSTGDLTGSVTAADVFSFPLTVTAAKRSTGATAAFPYLTVTQAIYITAIDCRQANGDALVAYLLTNTQPPSGGAPLSCYVFGASSLPGLGDLVAGLRNGSITLSPASAALVAPLLRLPPQP